MCLRVLDDAWTLHWVNVVLMRPVEGWGVEGAPKCQVNLHLIYYPGNSLFCSFDTINKFVSNKA